LRVAAVLRIIGRRFIIIRDVFFVGGIRSKSRIRG